MRRLTLAHFIVSLCIAPAAIAWGQDTRPEYSLQWKLPHDTAAIYEVFDGLKGNRKSDFWLLSCELSGRVGSTQSDDLPLRYVFRIPTQKLKVGSQFEVNEYAFGESASLDGISPVKVAGAYRVLFAKKIRLDEHLKIALKSLREDRTAEVLAIEGIFEIHRSQFVDGKLAPPEQRASATLTTLTYCRLSDGAILGGKYQWNGRTEGYPGNIATPRIGRGTDAGELAWRGPIIELNRKALAPLIDKAVNAGSKWLRSQQEPNGKLMDKSYPVGTSGGFGSTSLGLLALLHSGVSKDDPSIRKGFLYLEGKRITEPYDLALFIMATEAKYLPLEMFEDLENYSEDAARRTIAQHLTKADVASVGMTVDALLSTQAQEGGFGYLGGISPNFSHSQYAALALKSAARMGIAIQPIVWRKLVGFVERNAILGNGIDLKLERRGILDPESSRTTAIGWFYEPGKHRTVSGSMTCSAAGILAIASSELLRANQWTQKDDRIFKELAWGALAWIQEHYGVRAATPEGCPHRAAMPYYYLYGLERALILLDVQKIGEHAWYWEGAGVVLSWQRPDGSWIGPHGTGVIDTAWAQLFLKRATVPVETPGRVASIDTTKKNPEKEK